MFVSVIIALISSLYFYVQAFRSGLAAKRWALGGLLFGPLLLPLFNIKQHMALRKIRGFKGCFLRA